MQNDKFFDDNFEEIQQMVVVLRRNFCWRKNGWKWISFKGLVLLLNITRTHQKMLLKAALEWLEVKQKKCSYLGSLCGRQRSIFYLMPPPAEWLQPLVEALKKQCHQQKCKRCGVVIPIDRNHHFCADCVALRKEEKKKTPKPKSCVVCGVEFLPTAPNQKCCSLWCSTIRKKEKKYAGI